RDGRIKLTARGCDLAREHFRTDLQHPASSIEGKELAIQRWFVHHFAQRSQLHLCLLQLPFRGEGQATNVMPGPFQECVLRRRGFLENLIPPSESCQRP